ncbi:TIGR02391 family protein [Tersicoccus sp. MR15.9]|uniref:TIGR02391 family protein n=1 Tax=Tersicoccus mangrovi TaxID=3121635 RepID=UPI002FE684BC
MRADKAIGALEALKEEASTRQVMGGGEHWTSWKGKVRGVLVAALGKDDHLVDRFDKVRYSLGMWSTSTPDRYFEQARQSGIRNACGVIDAALYHLRLQVTDDEPLDLRSFDPELWEHVRHLVEDGDWGKVASQTAIFVEHRIRTWTGEPSGKQGEALVGKGLMAHVFGDSSDWRLGSRAGEREGWRGLGMGFAQALGNVDRHRIQKRDDARRYAIGVLGLGSLLLTQLRHEHGDLIEDRQTGEENRREGVD